MLHRHYSNRRPQNSAPYNRIICQTVEIKNVISFEAVIDIVRFCERLPRLQIQFRQI